MSWSWNEIIGQGSWSSYSSIGMSIRRILCGFSSPKGRGFGLGKNPKSCVHVSFFFGNYLMNIRRHILIRTSEDYAKNKN